MNKKLDPRTKLVIVLILSSLSLFYNKIEALILILFAAILIAKLAQINLTSLYYRIKKIIYIIFLIALAQSILTKKGAPILTIGGVTLLTEYGILSSVEFILRMGIIIVSAAIITTSTEREIIQGLIQWHLPYEIAFMTSAAIRFLPVFKEEMTDMLIAIQLRGIELKKIKNKEKIQIYKYILLPITINSFIKAKELAAAMEMRGFRAYNKRTSYMVLKLQLLDYAVMGLSITAAFLFIIFQ